mmetsp:Transcript_24277/g.62581  ORF Transcript_24277/g.62581 Transcript_24277/m.62581 type:complete len:214 (-) Transcript_24277:683-1324(-)
MVRRDDRAGPGLRRRNSLCSAPMCRRRDTAHRLRKDTRAEAGDGSAEERLRKRWLGRHGRTLCRLRIRALLPAEHDGDVVDDGFVHRRLHPELLAQIADVPVERGDLNIAAGAEVLARGGVVLLVRGDAGQHLLLQLLDGDGGREVLTVRGRCAQHGRCLAEYGAHSRKKRRVVDQPVAVGICDHRDEVGGCVHEVLARVRLEAASDACDTVR